MSDPKLTKRTELYAHAYLRVVEDRYDHEEEELCYFVKEDPDFSVVGAITEDGKILMLRQFRPGPGRFCYDMPAGMIDPGDTALETAHKELLEETGYVAAEMELVTVTYVSAYSTARKHIFLARGCKPVQAPEEEENVVADPVLMDVEDFVALVRAEPIIDLDCALILADSLGYKIF